MKKFIIISLFVFGISTTNFAQSNLLIKAGVHSLLNGSTDINSATVKGGKVGWNIGFDYRMGNYVFFQPGIHYYSSSLSVKADSATVNQFKNSARLQSLKLPLMLAATPFNLKRSDFAIVFNAGVIPTFNLGIVDENNFIKDKDISKVNWSGGVGAGLEFGPLIFGAYMEFGLSELFNEGKNKFNVIGATAGIKL